MPYFKAFLRLSLQAILKNSAAIHKLFRVPFTLRIATLALLARNDGQRKRTLSFYNDGGFVILSFR